MSEPLPLADSIALSSPFLLLLQHPVCLYLLQCITTHQRGHEAVATVEASHVPLNACNGGFPQRRFTLCSLFLSSVLPCNSANRSRTVSTPSTITPRLNVIRRRKVSLSLRFQLTVVIFWAVLKLDDVHMCPMSSPHFCMFPLPVSRGVQAPSSSSGGQHLSIIITLWTQF